MRNLLIRCGIIGIFLLLIYPIKAQENFVILNHVKMEGDKVLMFLSGETKYHAFKISNPPRLIVEFANTEHNWKEKQLDVNGKFVKRIRSGQFQNEPTKIARVVLDLNEMVEYELKSEGKIVSLIINPDVSSNETIDAKAPENQNEDFNQEFVDSNVQNTAQENDAETSSDFDEAFDEAFVDISATGSSENTTTVSHPTQTKMSPTKVEAPVSGTSKTTQKQTASGSAKKIKKTTTAKKSVKDNTDKKASAFNVVLPKKLISLDFEDADIRDVLRILSIKSGINIIYGSDVSGTITMHLENVPFDKAFDTILSLKGLVSQAQGDNILRIATPQKISEERSQAVTFTKIFPLNYSKAEEVKTNLDLIRSAEGRRGNISVDSRTNSLIVTDTPEGLLAVEKIISELDMKPPQVLIETKLVELTLNDASDLGIQWQYASSAYNENNLQVAIGQTHAETSSDAMGTGAVPSGNVLSVLTPSEGGTGVALPASPVEGQIGTFAFGVMVDNNLLTGMLSALSQKSLTKILSNPRVTTINNQEARILIGQRVPFTNVSINQLGYAVSSVAWQEVGIKLKVTPTINTDEQITLKIKPEVSLVSAVTSAGPVIASREAETTVIVKNHETVVIGGLIREEDRELGTQVPLLGDLPIIGHLFKRDYKTKERSELLVFITPQIIQ